MYSLELFVIAIYCLIENELYPHSATNTVSPGGPVSHRR